MPLARRSVHPVRHPLSALACLSLFALPIPLLAGCAEVPPRDAGERIDEAAQAQTTCVTVQRGGVGDIADALIDAHNPQQTYGASTAFAVAQFEESLLRFDLGAIPTGAVIDSATLNLYVYGSSDTQPVNFHPILAPWSEGTVTHATFNQQYDAATLSGALTATSGGAFTSVDLTALTQAWVSGTRPNYGVLAESVPQTTVGSVIFASSESAASTRPSLTVCYEPPAPPPACPCDFGSGWPVDLCIEQGLGTSSVSTVIEDSSGAYLAEIFKGDGSMGCYSMSPGGGSFVQVLSDQEVQACTAVIAAIDTTNVCGRCSANGCTSGTCRSNPSGDRGGDRCSGGDPCASAPCGAHGSCTGGGSGYTCDCSDGYTGTSCETPPACPCDFGSGWPVDLCIEQGLGTDSVSTVIEDSSGAYLAEIFKGDGSMGCYSMSPGGGSFVQVLSDPQVQACTAVIAAIDTTNVCGRCAASGCTSGTCRSNPSGDRGGDRCSVP